jgi:hypothetical protein
MLVGARGLVVEHPAFRSFRMVQLKSMVREAKVFRLAVQHLRPPILKGEVVRPLIGVNGGEANPTFHPLNSILHDQQNEILHFFAEPKPSKPRH